MTSTHSKRPKFVPISGAIAERCVIMKPAPVTISSMTNAEQADRIIATVYVNIKKRAEQGDVWAGEVVKWMDLEIAKLKDFRERYLACPSGACGCEACQQREADEAAGINYKAGEY